MTSTSKSPQPSKPETVAVVAHGRIDVATAVERVRKVAAGSGTTVVDEPADADLTVAVGGDGTILRTLARLLGSDVPVIGVTQTLVGTALIEAACFAIIIAQPSVWAIRADPAPPSGLVQEAA